MAVELDAQRHQLERTHRLEAWTEMARQIAHEIKNPLTPVQLSAEHLLRVHADRGSPLTPVLQGCVRIDPETGPDTTADRLRVLELRLLSGRQAYADGSRGPRERGRGTLSARPRRPHHPVGGSGAGSPPAAPRPGTDAAGDHERHRERAPCHARRGGPCDQRGAARRAGAGWSSATTGVGLEPDVLARIFEPYFSTRITGTGLGMAIAKRNVALNDGTIAVTSERGRAPP